jgi:hypothetical protein
VKTLIVIDAQESFQKMDIGPCQATTRFWPEFIGMTRERGKAELRWTRSSFAPFSGFHGPIRKIGSDADCAYPSCSERRINNVLKLRNEDSNAVEANLDPKG